MSSIQRAPYRAGHVAGFLLSMLPLHTLLPGGQWLTARGDPALRRHSTGQWSLGSHLKARGSPSRGTWRWGKGAHATPARNAGSSRWPRPRSGSLRTRPVPARAAILGPMWRCRGQIDPRALRPGGEGSKVRAGYRDLTKSSSSQGLWPPHLGLCGDRGCFQKPGFFFAFLCFLINLRATSLHKRHLFQDGSPERMECRCVPLGGPWASHKRHVGGGVRTRRALGTGCVGSDPMIFKDGAMLLVFR